MHVCHDAKAQENIKSENFIQILVHKFGAVIDPQEQEGKVIYSLQLKCHKF